MLHFFKRYAFIIKKMYLINYYFYSDIYKDKHSVQIYIVTKMSIQNAELLIREFFKYK